MDAPTQLMIQIAMDNGVNGVYQLLQKAFQDGEKRGRKQVLDEIERASVVNDIKSKWQ